MHSHIPSPPPRPHGPFLTSPRNHHYSVEVNFTSREPDLIPTVLNLIPRILNLIPRILNLIPRIPNLIPTVLNLIPRILNLPEYPTSTSFLEYSTSTSFPEHTPFIIISVWVTYLSEVVGTLHQRLLQGCFLEMNIANAVRTMSYTILDTHGDSDFKVIVQGPL